MKRRYDEGYALPFALVVLLFLCIVAMCIMDLTYRDLNAQQDSIARMKDQYVAQGELEKIVALLENAESEAELNIICNNFSSPEGNSGSAQQNEVTGSNEFVVTIHLEQPGAKYKVTIDCGLKLSLQSGQNSVEYSSYSISSEKLPDPGNGGGS